MSDEPALYGGGLVGRDVVEDDVHVEGARDLFVDEVKNLRNSSERCRGAIEAMTLPEAASSAANRSVVPWRR